MSRARVANRKMNADGGAEAGQPDDRQSLPQAPRRPAAVNAQQHREAATADAAAEAGPVVRDQWNQARVDGVQIGRGTVSCTPDPAAQTRSSSPRP